MMTRKKKTPVVTCGLCGELGHSSAAHNQERKLYSAARLVRKGGNILGKKRR